eukprot:6490770-Amphidinium_carterae.3
MENCPCENECGHQALRTEKLQKKKGKDDEDDEVAVPDEKQQEDENDGKGEDDDDKNVQQQQQQQQQASKVPKLFSSASVAEARQQQLSGASTQVRKKSPFRKLKKAGSRSTLVQVADASGMSSAGDAPEDGVSLAESVLTSPGEGDRRLTQRIESMPLQDIIDGWKKPGVE